MQTIHKTENCWDRWIRILRVASRREIAWSSLRTSLVVGTVLNIINQGHLVAAGLPVSAVHAALNFVVPFCVATYSAARQSIAQAETAGG